MRTGYFGLLCALIGTLIMTAGCSATIAPSYSIFGDPPSTPDGPVFALAVNADRQAAVTKDGLYLRKADGPWVPVDIPGLRVPKKVSSLAIGGDEILVGSKGEGLFIYSDGVWEVKTSRYGGLPDDSVFSIAIEDDERGLPGKNVWVGTGKGLAVRRDGRWSLFTPDGDWLAEIAGPSSGDREHYFVPSGSRIGRPGEDRKKFRPPVTSIAIGEKRVVLGSEHSMLAYMEAGKFATAVLAEDVQIKSLLVESAMLWCGTSRGLLWGRLFGGGAVGVPYPSWRGPIDSATTLYGGRDAREFVYTFYRVGYNVAHVEDLARDDRGGLWVAYADREGPPALESGIHREDTAERPSTPVSGVWRYIAIDDHIAAKRHQVFEKYGTNLGVRGLPTQLEYTGDEAGVWLGTDSALYNLKR